MNKLPNRVIHRSRMNGQLTEIVDQGDLRSLYFASTSLQSSMSLAEPHRLILSYTTFMMFSLFLHAPTSVLLIGLGAGSLVRFIHHHFPKCRIDAVEISPNIIDLARGYFQLPSSQSITVHCQDGLGFLGQSPSRAYDLILLDAFTGQGMAATIYSASCFQQAAMALSDDGFLVCNLWSSEVEKQHQMRKDLAKCFAHLLYLPVPKRGNCIAFGGKKPIDWHNVNRAKAKQVTRHYGIDGQALVRVARRHNLGLWQRLLDAVAWPGRS